MSDPTKVADEREALLQRNNYSNQNESNYNRGEQINHSKTENSADKITVETKISYVWDFIDHSKSQFFLLSINVVFFIFFKSNIDNDDNFPEGKDNCFSLRTWSILVEGSYLAGIFIRISYLILMAIVVYYKKKITDICADSNRSDTKNDSELDKTEIIKKKVSWNLRYKYLYEMRDIFLGAKIVIGIFLLVGMTTAISQSEPCGNLRNLALFWIYIYNIVFLFFPISMLLLCLYPYSFSCKIFSAFLKFYSLQLDIFEQPGKTKTD